MGGRGRTAAGPPAHADPAGRAAHAVPGPSRRAIARPCPVTWGRVPTRQAGEAGLATAPPRRRPHPALSYPAMISYFFIDRPIFATVLSVLITLIGGIAMLFLPIAQ